MGLRDLPFRKGKEKALFSEEKKKPTAREKNIVQRERKKRNGVNSPGEILVDSIKEKKKNEGRGVLPFTAWKKEEYGNRRSLQWGGEKKEY